MYYAKLNEENICVGVSQLSGEVHRENMMQIQTYDMTILGKRYVDGKWEDVAPELQPLTEQEQISIDAALTVEYMACLLESSLT